MHKPAACRYIKVTLTPHYQELSVSVVGVLHLLTVKLLCCNTGRVSSHVTLCFYCPHTLELDNCHALEGGEHDGHR